MYQGVPVGEGAVGGEPVRVGGFDASGGQHLSDDLAPVGVFGEGLAGPPPVDGDAPAVEAEVLPVVRRRGTDAGDQARAGVFGGDAVPQPDLGGAGSFRVHRSRAASGSSKALRCSWSM